MEKSGIEALTNRERECLRLVHEGGKSKPIARRIGIKPGTVDAHLKNAMRTLGVSNRETAAAMLAAHERLTSCQRLDTQSSSIELKTSSAPTMEPSRGEAGGAGSTLREAQAPFAIRARLPSLPLDGGRRNDLTIVQKLAWAFAIAIGSALLFGGIVAGIEALARLV